MKIYYFAYGSNMSWKQMKKRCGEENFKIIGKAHLKGYRFVYDGYSSYRIGAVANIVESENYIVWGGLYEINEECLKKLDKYEGYPSAYDRREVKVITDEGKEYKACVYLRTQQKIGLPSEQYREIVIQGAKDFNLPEDYIKNFLDKKGN